MEAWEKTKPSGDFPYITSRDTSASEVLTPARQDLPDLSPAEQSFIALVQPVVTIKRNFMQNRKYRQESINLLNNYRQTWCRILPRFDLKDRFVIIEQRFKTTSEKYMFANCDKVRRVLQYLFDNHPTYIRKLESDELQMSVEALLTLQSKCEIASVHCEQDSADVEETDPDPTEHLQASAELDAGLSTLELYSFEQRSLMYLRKEHALRIIRGGKLQLIKDDDESRQSLYDPHLSANVAFPYLYPKGESAPMDLGEHWLCRNLLKKQSQFVLKKSDGSLCWRYSENGVHMMHQ